MDRAWKQFTDSARSDATTVSFDNRPPSTQYAGDYATLVAIFRTQIASGARQHDPVARLASQLRRIAATLLDDFRASDSQHFLRQCVEDHGPDILMLALAKAYVEPMHVLGELEGD